MKRKWLFVVISLLLIAGMIAIGGEIHMDNKKEKEEKVEKIDLERKSVIALKNRYADIKAVEVKESRFDKKTGAFDVTVKMTNQNNESVSFTYPFWIEQEKIGAILIVDKKVQVKGITTNKVQVIYSNNEEGEV